MTKGGGLARTWNYSAVLFAVMFVLSAACAYIAPRGVPPLLGFTFLAALPLMSWGRRLSPGVLLILCFVLWAAISVTWSPLLSAFDITDLEDFTAFKLLIQGIAFCGLAAAAMTLTEQGAERVGRTMAYAYCALAAFLIAEGLTGAVLYQTFNTLIGETLRPDLARRNVAQGGYLLAVMLWPAAIILRRDKLNVLVLLLVDGVLGVMLTLGTDSPMVGLLAGAAAFAAVVIWGRRGVIGIGAAWVAYWLLAPWLVLASRGAGAMALAKSLLPASWDARLEIWSFAAEHIVQKPVAGWGVGASRVFPQIPLHTHNAAIQHWLELGVIGAVLAAAVWAWLFGLIARRSGDRGWAATATATLTTFLTISALSFSAWEEWWLGAGGLGLVACIALGRSWQGRVAEKPEPPPPKPWPGLLTLLLRRPWGKSPAFRRVKTP